MNCTRGFFLAFGALALAALGLAQAQPGRTVYHRNDDQNQDGRQSRSGRVHYGTSNNLFGAQAAQTPINISRAPTRQDLMQAPHDQQPRIHYQVYNDTRYRVGYYLNPTRLHNHQDQDGHHRHDDDDYFCYPHYVFNPYLVSNSVVSPWYYYPSLPGYLDTNRLVITSNYDSSFVGLPYDYTPGQQYADNGYDRDSRYDANSLDRRNLDYSIDDIVNAFTHQDRRAVDRLVPRDGTVAITVDGTITYGLNADDFYDLLMDAVNNANTIDYEITGVKASQDEAEVLAVHEFADAWGRRQTVYHRYHLFSERGSIVIRSFETSIDPFW